MARRKGNEWFVGALTNNEGSAQSVNLSFLDKGKTYLARIYTDGGDKIKTRTQVKCTRLLVDSSQIMQFALKPRRRCGHTTRASDGSGNKRI